MALFVATLATLIVTALFYRQFVLLRTIENQQLISQSRLLLRGALDWGRAILREDANRSSYDALSEPWAQPLAETRLDQLGETGSIASLASIAGSMEDAQGRYNLRNLVNNGEIVDKELESLRRLASLLQLPTQTADLIAERMLESAGPGASGRRQAGRRGQRERRAHAAVAVDAAARHQRRAGHQSRGGRPPRPVYCRARREHPGERQHRLA